MSELPMTMSDRGAKLTNRTHRVRGATPLSRRTGLFRATAIALDGGLSLGAALMLARACATGPACDLLSAEATRIGLLAAVLFVSFGLGRHGYSRSALLRPPFSLLLGNWLTTLLLLGVFGAALRTGAMTIALPLALYGFLGFMAVLAGRELLALGLTAAYDTSLLSRFRTLALARTREDAEALARRLVMEQDSEVVGTMGASSLDSFVDMLRQGGVDRVVVQTGGLAREELAELLQRLRPFPVSVHFLAGAPRLTGFQRPADEMAALPVFAVKREPLSRAERWGKRSFDLVVASLALVLLAPALLAVTLALRACGRRQVFAREVRTGFDGRPFVMRSFATSSSVPGREQGEPGLLERSGLRALPRLLNVVSGDLSLVGPCPLGPAPTEADRNVARFAALQGLKPGLAHGFVVESPLGLTPVGAARQRLRLDDLAYLDQWSFTLDLAVLASGLGRHCVVRERQEV